MANAPLRDRRWYPPVAGLACGIVFLAAALAVRDYAWPLALLGGLAIAAWGWWTEGLRRHRRLRGLDEREMGLH